jgi:hypothetical protein
MRDVTEPIARALVWTNSEGRIVDMTPDAGVLLNLDPDRAVHDGRDMKVFVSGRYEVATALDMATRGHREMISTRLIPREKRRRPVRLVLEAEARFIRWTIETSGG